MKFSCEFLPVTPDLSALKERFWSNMQAGHFTWLGCSENFTYLLFSWFPGTSDWKQVWRKECGNEWMLHKVPILVWLMIVSCFLVSVFYFTVLSQNTASLSFRNYSEELQKGRPLWKCVTNRWCSEDLEICTSLRWHTVRSSSLQAFWTTFFQILEDFH